MSALNAALCGRGIILWLAAVLLLASRSTHSAPVYDQNTTQVAEYDGAIAGCYFNFQRYQEGDRIITSEPCLNCTCHNRMLMCYLKVCPFTKAIGQDCTVEKRPDQCCPVITCPEVPVQLLTSTTSAPAISDSTEIGFHDNYGCHVDERFYPDGAMLPVDHHNPCELCYCIRNRTTCVMQECTLRVAGCKPVYQPGICCPIKYNCEYDEEPSTTVGPTPGLIMTTTLPPGVLPQCDYEGKIYEDGDLIYSTQPCQHCYCFRGEIACAVQNCGTPMEAHGKNCTALPPPEGECCPTTYQCEEEEQGTITLPEESEEQLPEQVSHDLEITESPMVIDQEDQQIKSEHPLEEAFPGADNIISQVPEGEEEIHGMIEHVTQEHIPSTEKPEEQPEDQTATLPTDENIVSETETEAAEKEFIPSHDHITETSSIEVTPEEEVITTKVPSEAETMKTEAPMDVQEIEGATEAAVELTSSTSQSLQPEEEAITVEHKAEEHTTTEESPIEKEHTSVTEKELPTEPSISKETEEVVKIEPEETTSLEELPAQVPEEATEREKATEEEQVGITEAPERSEISTDIIEEATSPITKTEESSSIESVTTEQTKEGENEIQTSSDETHTMEIPSGLPEEQETVTTVHEVPSIEQAITEKGEVSHLTEIAVTEETQPTEISSHPEESSIQQEQKPVMSEREEEQQPEQAISEHTPIVEEEHVTSEEPIFTEKEYAEGQQEETSPEIPAQGPTGIPIPERSPEQKAEDENVYHVTEDYYGVKHPEISPDNLMTESPQEISETSETSSSQEEQATLIPSEEIAKPIPEETTEIILSNQTESEPEIIQTSTSAEETKEEGTSAITEVQVSTESSTTTVAYREENVSEEKIHEEIEETSVPIEIETKAPQVGVQLTEKTPSNEELPTKGLGIEESGETSSEEISNEQIEKEMRPKKEQSSEKETQPSIVMQPEAVSEIPLSTVPAEYEQSVESMDISKEQQTLHGEHITTVIPSLEQSTQIQGEEKETGTILEEEKPVTSEKPIEKPISEQSTIIPEISGEEEKESYTENFVSKEEQTTEAIKMVEEHIEKSTTQTPIIEENKTEQPEQYSTEKISEEVAITEAHGIQETKAPTIEEKPEEIESTQGILLGSTEGSIEAMITEKELPKEAEQEPTEITDIEQTELPVIEEHITEPSEIEKESEEKILVPVSAQETEAPIIEIESTEASVEEQQTKEMHIEPSASEEHLPSQSSVPSDRKEDQESVELKPSEEEQEIEERITQKPSLEEKEVTEIKKESQEPTIPSEMEATHAPSSEESVTVSALPEEKPSETTEFVGINEIETQSPLEEQPEIVSEQPDEVATELSGSEEHTQSPVTEEEPELHVRKETETPDLVTPIESFITPSSTISKEPVVGEEGVINKSTETAISESTTILVSISEVSTASPEFEEHTEHEGEVPIEKETVTEFTSLEKEQPEITQPSITEEKPSQERDEAEVTSPEESKEGTIPEMSEIPVIGEHPFKSEEEEIPKETITEMPIHEEYSTIAPEEIPEVKITTETPLKEIPQYSTEHPTSIPEETPVEEETTSEIVLRPSGIPGEGNCLVEGQSYSNNSAVPPANICQTSCRCISSIVQCELVECPAPPAHLSNCMPIHMGGESCCPMYACDSTPTVELESDNHMVEPYTPETEEDKKDVPLVEVSTEVSTEESTEAMKESSTIIDKISTPESQPATEVTIPSISPSEDVTETEKQTTLKSTFYEESTITGQSIEQHSISSMPETSTSQELEEEETKLPIVPNEITESTVSGEEESVTKASTEQPQKEIIVSISDEEMITSTHEPVELEPHGAEKEDSIPHKEEEEEITIPIVTEKEETHIPVEVTTITAGKEKETTVSIKEEEAPTEKIDIKEESTLKPIEKSEETEKEQPTIEEIQPTASEEPSTVKEYETSTELEESIVTKEPVISEVVEEQHTTKSTEYETTSVPEIQSTIAHKPEEGEEVTSFESEQTTQAEKAESQTKLPDTVLSEAETQKPIVSTPESTTFVSHDYTETELPLSHMTTKSVEVSTEKSKEETEPKVPEVKEEHVTVPIEIEVSSEETTEQELEKSSEETIKSSEESTPSHEEITPEITTEEEITAVEITEHVETHTEPSLADHEKETSETSTKLSEEEKAAESESPVSTEHPVKAVEVEEAELEKTTEFSIVHELESTEVSEEHSEATPETESHAPELPVQEHTKIEEEITTSIPVQEEIDEQFVTPIIKETEPSLSEAEPEQSEIESEVPGHVEHVTVTVEEQTPKSEEHPVEKQTTSFIPSETTEVVLTEEATTESVSQKEQTTEKSIESVKPETELPSITEKETITPEIQKEVEEEEQQKSEAGITEEAGKEEPVTVPEVMEVITESKEGTTEEAIKEEVASTTEEHLPAEEHPEQEATSPETEPDIKVHEPMEPETTNVPIEEKPDEEAQASEATFPEQPTSEETTTVASLIPEEHLTVSTETEKEDTEKSGYQTTLSNMEEEVTRPTTEVEKLSPEEESSITEAEATTASVEVSPSEKPAEVLPETGRPIVLEQETELPEQQGEATTKRIESAVIEKESSEEMIPAEIIPETEEKPSETPSEVSEKEEHSTVSIETTSIREAEEPSITKLQPTEESIPSDGKITEAEEVQPSQTEEAHPAISEEDHPISGVPEEPQFTTEHMVEVPVTIKEEEHAETEQPGISSEAATQSTEAPIEVSTAPTESSEEQITVKPVPSEESIPEVSIRPEESPQSTELPAEQHVKIQPEFSTAETPEEISEEEIVHPQEGEAVSHPHVDHFPEATTKSEPEDSAEGELGSDEEHQQPVNHTAEVTKRPTVHKEQPMTTLAPHIPEYPDQVVSGEDNPHFPVQSGSYFPHDEDYDEDDQIYGPGTCRYGGKVYVSAQQIPRDDPCDFCFCFRSDIICLQQSCPPPIPGCHEEPISGFCCPRYECPVSMATALNLTTTTTTTTTTLPPHFHAHAYKGAARRNGCLISGKAYRVGEVIKSASGPCLQCTCGGDGNMKCDPRVCTPEPMLRQMIAAVAAERRRR